MGIGKTLVILGIICIAAGLFFMAGGKLSFLGHLPGDIHFFQGAIRMFTSHGYPAL